MAIGPQHRLALRNETIVSIGINAFLPSAVIWLLDVMPPRELIGPTSILAPMILAAGFGTLMMTLVLTTIVRARVRRGQLPALDWPRSERGAMRFVPGPLLLRAIALGLVASVSLVPAGVAIIALLDILPLTKVGFLVFNSLFGAAVAWVMARYIVLTALADPVTKRAVVRPIDRADAGI